MRNFKNYDIWKLSHELTLDIYKVTQNFPKIELYNIVSQIRRAATSIPTNISEGCGRDSDKEFNRFLTFSLGSTTEVEYLLILSKDLNYFENEIYNVLNHKINTIKSKIYTLKQKLK